LSGTRFDPAIIESLKTVVKLTEIGLMQLPTQPSQLPNIWLEEELTSKSQPQKESTI
jgi:hypothetical protein